MERGVVVLNRQGDVGTPLEVQAKKAFVACITLAWIRLPSKLIVLSSSSRSVGSLDSSVS